MADNQGRISGTGAEGASLEKPRGGFLNSIVDIFVDPYKVFARIDAGLTWWKPFVLVTAVATFMAYLMLPFQQRLVELNPRGMSAEQVEAAGKFAPVGLIMVPIMLIIITVIVAAIVHLAVNIMSSRSSYKKTLSLISYCGIITMVEQIIGNIVLKTRGLESVESASDLRFSLSLAPLVSDGTGLLGAALQNLGIFQIWYYIVLILGLAAIFRISRKQAIIPALSIWILSVVITAFLSRLGGTG